MITAARADVAVTAQMVKALAALPDHDSLGVACAVLQILATKRPELVRRVLNEPIVREGFGGTTLLTIFKRVSKE